jgi:hypothetical protein
MELLDWIFFGPARLIAYWRYAGVAVALALIVFQAWLTWRSRKLFNMQFFREPAVFTGFLWLIFNAFELQMSATAARNGTVPFRLDLIFLVPLLYAMTIAAIVSIARQFKAIALGGVQDSR